MFEPLAVLFSSAVGAVSAAVLWRYGVPIVRDFAGGLFVVQRQLTADRERIQAQLRLEIDDLQRQLDREIRLRKDAEARIDELERLLDAERLFNNKLLHRLGFKREDIMRSAGG